MNIGNPTLQDLFNQLGLKSDGEAIDHFIETHKGLSSHTKLEEALFWNPSQSNLLRSALQDDAEWAELIDQLNNRLR